MCADNVLRRPDCISTCLLSKVQKTRHRDNTTIAAGVACSPRLHADIIYFSKCIELFSLSISGPLMSHFGLRQSAAFSVLGTPRLCLLVGTWRSLQHDIITSRGSNTDDNSSCATAAWFCCVACMGFSAIGLAGFILHRHRRCSATMGTA